VLAFPSNAKAMHVSRAKSTEIMAFLQSEPPKSPTDEHDTEKIHDPSFTTTCFRILEMAFTVVQKSASFAKLAFNSMFAFWREPTRTILRNRKPILRMSIFRIINMLLSADRKQPWLIGAVQLLGKPLSDQPAGSFIDK
jgi:hypothetical protein